MTKPLRLAGKIARRVRNHFRRKPEITNPAYLSRIADNKAYCAIPESEYPARLCAWFKEVTGEDLHLDAPLTFDEKLNWLKLYDSTSLKTLCADKLRAPQWAKKRCPELHTVKILHSWKHARDIDFSKLPQKFVLKCNHGSGMNIIVTDKSTLNIPEVVEKLNYWMAMDYSHWNHSFELHYSKIPRRIICEEYIESEGVHGLLDYKIHCFNGVPKFVQVMTDRTYEHYGYNQAIFDTKWNNLHIKHDGHDLLDASFLKKPECLSQMLAIAKKLCEPFVYVRVDLYLRSDGIYFGELTFTPAMGTIRWDPPETDIVWGKLLKLP